MAIVEVGGVNLAMERPCNGVKFSLEVPLAGVSPPPAGLTSLCRSRDTRVSATSGVEAKSCCSGEREPILDGLP